MPLLLFVITVTATTPWVLGLRALAAAAIGVLLYRVLGEPGQGWSGGRPAVLRRAGFALVGCLVFFQITAALVPEQGGGQQGKGFQSFFQGSLQFRTHFLPESFKSQALTPPRDQALTYLRQAVRESPESVHFRRYLAVVLAERKDYAGARKELDAAMKLLDARAPDRARQERHFWNELYGSRPPEAQRLEEARATAERFRFGWLGRVAVLAAWQRVPEAQPPRDLKRQVEDEAGSWFQGMATGGIGALCLIPQLGLIAVVVAMVLIRSGVVRPAPVRQNPVGYILWESFVLMMACGPALMLIGLPRASPETQPQLAALRFLSVDLLQIGVVVYLALRLRGKGHSLAEIGLSRENLGANIVVGLMAAVVMVPLAYAVGIVTQAVSDRLFPNIAPPYHPLQGLTATSASPEIRAALFIAAAVGAPIFEEIFFRGALYGAIRRRLGIGAGLVLSSAFFAVLHPQLPLGFLPIAVLGAVFAGLYEWRQSLVPGMVAHAFNNGLIFLLLNLFFPLNG